MFSSNVPPAAWCGYGGSCARAPTPWQIGCDGWPGVAELGEALADAPVQLGHRLGRASTRSSASVVHLEQPSLELGVLRLQLAEHEVLRVVGPVAVGADPDLEEHGLALDDRQVGRRRERLDPLARPDERERQRELDVVARRALPVHEALPDRRRPRTPSSPARTAGGRGASPASRSRSRCACARSPARS